MIIFRTLSIRNFLSYGNVPTELKLDEKNLVLIQGLVGCGKSSISRALNYCLYNKTDESNIDSMINNINKSNMEVSVVFEKTSYGFYKIVRCRKMKSQDGNYVKVYHNLTEEIFEDRHEISLDSIKSSDNLIVDILGITYDMFIRMVSVSSNTDDFLNLPTVSSNKLSQQSFLEQLFNLDILNEKAAVLKDSIKETDAMVKEHITKIEYVLKEQERIEIQIKNTKQKSDEHQLMVDGNIQKYQTQLKQIDSIDLEKEQQYIEVSSNLKAELQSFKQEHKEISYKINNVVDKKKQMEQQINTLTDKSKEHDSNVKDDINKLNDKLKVLLEVDVEMEKQYIELSNKVKQELLEIKSTMKDLNEHYNHHKSIKDKTILELDSLNSKKCPRCDQHYHNEEDIKKCQNIVHESDIKINQLYEQLTVLSETKNNKIVDYEKYNSKVSVNGLEDLITIQNNIEKIKDKISDLSSSNNVYAEQLNELLEKVDDVVDDEKMLDSLFTRLEDLDNEMNNKKSLYDSIIEKSTITDLEELVTLKNRAEHIQDKIKDLNNSKNIYMEHLSELENIPIEKADYEGLDKIKNILNHQQFLYKILTKKDSFVRQNLLSSNLKFLNSRIAEYLQLMNFPYIIMFNEDLTSTIRYLGRDLVFANLSSGQKCKVGISLFFSFLDVNKKNAYSCNLLIMDEIVDRALDAESLSQVVKLLKHKSTQDDLNLFVVSHRETIKHKFDNVIDVYLEDNFSKLNYSWK
jgi:DNA repair exonuclease SbcCD ATPase subunit